MEIMLISGTFEPGCGVIIHDKTTDKMYHKIVFKDEFGCYIEVDDHRIYKEDLNVKKQT